MDVQIFDTFDRIIESNKIPKRSNEILYHIDNYNGILTGNAENKRPIALRYFKKFARGIKASLK